MAEPPVRKVYPGKGGVGRAHHAVTATGIRVIEKMAANGCKLESIAAALGISHDTLQACRQRQPEVQDAIDSGRAVMHDELVDILMQQAREGAFVPAIFLLKTRFGYREGVQIEGSIDVNHTGGVLVVPAEMTVEQYLAKKAAEGDLIDVTPSGWPNPNPVHPAIEHLPEVPVSGSRSDPAPAPRRTPSGTRIGGGD